MKFIYRYKWAIFTLFIWAIIFCVPTLRYHLHVATKGSPWVQFTLSPAHYGDDYSFSKLKNPPLPIKAHLLGNNFNFISISPKEALAPLDELIRQHPHLP